jgi:DNA-binding NarL/FixJ family response regulator
MERPTRVAIVDDQAVFRNALRNLLLRVPALQVVGEAANGIEAVEVVEAKRPDVVLMDVNMPVMDGIEATRVIASRFPCVRVIVLSLHEARDLAERACKAGACMYLCKECTIQDLITAIHGPRKQIMAEQRLAS